MRDVFYLNEKSYGYSVLIDDGDGQLVRPNSENRKALAPAGYEEARRQLEGALTADRARPYLHLSHQFESDQILLAYALDLPLPDEHGRVGISFCHAREVQREDAPAALAAIAILLSSSHMAELGRRVGAVASGTLAVQNFSQELKARLANLDLEVEWSGIPNTIPVRAIVQDCSGTAYAWFLMLFTHARLNDYWVIEEELDRKSGLVRIRSSLPKAVPRLRLSEALAHASGAESRLIAVEAYLGAWPGAEPPSFVVSDAPLKSTAEKPWQEDGAQGARVDGEGARSSSVSRDPTSEQIDVVNLPQRGELASLDAGETRTESWELGLRTQWGVEVVRSNKVLSYQPRSSYIEVQTKAGFVNDLIGRPGKKFVVDTSGLHPRWRDWILRWCARGSGC